MINVYVSIQYTFIIYLHLAWKIVLFENPNILTPLSDISIDSDSGIKHIYVVIIHEGLILYDDN